MTPPLDAQLKEQFDLVVLPATADERKKFLADRGAEFDAVAIHVRHDLTGDVIAGLPNLKAVCNFGVGYDKIDIESLKARGVQLSNTPNVLNGCVADLAMGLLIDVARGISASDRSVRRGDWANGKTRPLMTRVAGKKMGILGFGGIGQVIAKRAAGFDMEVRYNSRNPVKGFEDSHEKNLVELAKWADFLMVACVGGPTTHHLVSAEVLEALGPRGIVVNIARGSVIDEAALVKALQESKIGGAGLDVFENEPHVPKEMLEMDNVVALPHMAGFTRETRQGMEQAVLDNLNAYFNTGKVLAPVW